MAPPPKAQRSNGPQRPKPKNQPKQQNGKKASRKAARAEVKKQIADITKKMYSSTIIGAGAYNFRKAATGKYAARKRGNTMRKLIDIGGRSLGALHQFNSGDYMGALQSGMKILGHGDYQLTQNSIVDDMTAAQVPVMHSANESIRLRHREFVMEVFSPQIPGSFSTVVFPLNPGLQTTFPFLASIAQQFQEYSFKGLVFEFKSTSAVAMSTTNLGLGTVALAAQYRADAPAFTNKVQMMNEMWAVDGKPSDTFMLPIECAPAESPMSVFYVRGGLNVPTNDNVKFYDLAKVTLAMSGIPVAQQLIGELWISYDVEFFKPQSTAVTDMYQNYLKYSLAPSGSACLLGGSISLDMFGFVTGTTIPPRGTFVGNSTSGLIGASEAGGLYTQINNTQLAAGAAVGYLTESIIFPLGTVGRYMLNFYVNVTSSTITMPVGSDAYGNSCNGVQTYAFQNNWRKVDSYYTSLASTTAWSWCLVIDIPSSSAQCVVSFAYGGFTTPASGKLTVVQLNASAT